MCQVVILNGQEIKTVEAFEKAFDTTVNDIAEGVPVIKTSCLCQIKVDRELKKINVPFTWDRVYYHVT